MRVDQILSRFGYCSRSEARRWVRDGRVEINGTPARTTADKTDAENVRIDGESVDSPQGILALFHKPEGCVCSHDGSEGPTVYDLLPARWALRNPPVTTVGRLDKATTGLLVLTDLGSLVHRWTSPRKKVPKLYEATLDRPADPAWRDLFASGDLKLEGEDKPCLPAVLELTGERSVTVELTEGRYHQVRRMFAACGATVLALHRTRFGPFNIDGLESGAWRQLDPLDHLQDSQPQSKCIALDLNQQPAD